MRTLTTPDVVIKRRDYHETDRILTIFTRNFGKITARARGVRRPLSKMSGHMEMLGESNFRLVEGRAWHTVSDAVILKSFNNIQKDIEKIGQAYVLFEIVDVGLQEHEPNENIYIGLVKSLELLNLTQLQIIPATFLWYVLGQLGYIPELYKCVNSGEKLSQDDKLYFSSQEGGLIDKKHIGAGHNHIPLSKNTVKLMRIVLKDVNFINRVSVDENIQKEFIQVADNYFEYYIERDLKAPKFLNYVKKNLGRNKNQIT